MSVHSAPKEVGAEVPDMGMQTRGRISVHRAIQQAIKAVEAMLVEDEVAKEIVGDEPSLIRVVGPTRVDPTPLKTFLR